MTTPTTVREAPPPAPGPPPGRRTSAPLSAHLAGRFQGGLPALLGLAAAATGTTWVAMWSWRGFTTQSGQFLGPLLLLGIVVALLGVALRLARLPVIVIVGLQSVVGFLAAQAMITGHGLPTPTALRDLGDRFSAALESSQQYAAPVPAIAPGVEPLLILGGLACLLLVDLLACSLRRAPLAGLPLLTIYTIPVSVTGSGVSWWVFCATAAGFVLMLFLQESEHLSRWGRTLGQDSASADPSGFGVRTGDVRTSAAGIAALATGVALLLPVLIPTVTIELFSGGFGPGRGDDLRIENPMTDLRRDLQRGEDIPLLRVSTVDPNPSYLRIAVLTRLGDDEWSSGDREVPQENLAQGDMPSPRGVGGEVLGRAREIPYQVSIADEFGSLWLPTSQHVADIFAPGDWRYDVDTMDFLSGDRDEDTSGLDYSFTKLALDLSGAELARAPRVQGAVSPDFTLVPGDLPPVVLQITRQVTEGYATPYQRAVALQNWFREDGNFTYDINVPEGTGTQDLVGFLTEGPEGRIGYCEQFASAMAAMARTIGIPARVAVGFLSPESIGTNRWEYSAHDMHAWPELYFPGSGWVRFEPTPAAGPRGSLTTPPPYTLEELPQGDLPTDGPSDIQPGEDLPTRGGDAATADPSADDEAASGGGGLGPLGRGLLAGGGAVLLLVGLAFVPRVLRGMRRERRWRVGGPLTAWVELRDAAIDLGIPWRLGLSPRATRDRLVEHFGAPLEDGAPERPLRGPAVAPRAVAALDRIVHEVELLRYARRPGTADDPGLRHDTELCLASLEGGATRGARRRARWWPRSLFRRAPRTEIHHDVEPTTRQGVVIDHVG
jgi:transglutaminase-like putative cysteine protease